MENKKEYLCHISLVNAPSTRQGERPFDYDGCFKMRVGGLLLAGFATKYIYVCMKFLNLQGARARKRHEKTVFSIYFIIIP
jgi:hypothetical protein